MYNRPYLRSASVAAVDGHHRRSTSKVGGAGERTNSQSMRRPVPRRVASGQRLTKCRPPSGRPFHCRLSGGYSTLFPGLAQETDNRLPMDRHESSPAYLERCSQAFLDAVAEARALALAGDARLADTLHFARDLLDIIADGLDSPEKTNRAAADALGVLRGLLHALQSDLAPRGPLH